MSTAFTVWCTGLPSCGKSELGRDISAALQRDGHRATFISSSEHRASGETTVGFSEADRHTHLMTITEDARALMNQGVIAVVAAVSPFAASRAVARDRLERFVEVHVATPKPHCIDADRHGTWAQALNGEIRNFTGVDHPYEAPEQAEIVVDLSQQSVSEARIHCLDKLSMLGFIATD